MKIISIGREDTCNIILHDPESLISRKHALLKVFWTGKMEIIDMSTNGTYVNGNAIAKNKPYPVTRKDVVSFARVKQLDWSLVPDNLKSIKIAAAVVIALTIIIVAIALWPSKKVPYKEYSSEVPGTAACDTLNRDKSKDGKSRTTDGKETSDLDMKEYMRKEFEKKQAEQRKKEAERQKSKNESNNNNDKSGKKEHKDNDKKDNSTENGASDAFNL